MSWRPRGHPGRSSSRSSKWYSSWFT